MSRMLALACVLAATITFVSAETDVGSFLLGKSARCLISPEGNWIHDSQRSFYKHTCPVAASRLSKNALLAISVRPRRLPDKGQEPECAGGYARGRRQVHNQGIA